MLTFDVAIVGAGPAGCSAAIALARAGTCVTLVERSRFPRHKVCGEFVSAESLALLRSLLTSSPLRHLNEPGFKIGRTRIFIDGRVIEAEIAPPAASITRYDLDFSLWNAAQHAGCECIDGCEVIDAVFDTGAGFTLRTTAGQTVTARAVIDAAGRWAPRLRGDKPPAGPKWIGLKCHYATRSEFHVPPSNTSLATDEPGAPSPRASVDLYFLDGGYCGVQPISASVVNACAMVRSDRATTLDGVLLMHPALAERSRKWTPLFDPIATSPLVFRDPQPLRALATDSGKPETGNSKPLFCVGDTAAFIDPFVGDGISLALRTGVAAAEALLPFIRGEQSLPDAASAYATRYHREFAPILRSAARVRRLLGTPRPLRAAALAAMRLPFVANYVIRKTRTVA